MKPSDLHIHSHILTRTLKQPYTVSYSTKQVFKYEEKQTFSKLIPVQRLLNCRERFFIHACATKWVKSKRKHSKPYHSYTFYQYCWLWLVIEYHGFFLLEGYIWLIVSIPSEGVYICTGHPGAAFITKMKLVDVINTDCMQCSSGRWLWSHELGWLYWHSLW